MNLWLKFVTECFSWLDFIYISCVNELVCGNVVILYIDQEWKARGREIKILKIHRTYFELVASIHNNPYYLYALHIYRVHMY